MARSYADLVNEVRAQIDVDPSVALAWLLDRSRVLNAEAGWNLETQEIPATESYTYELPERALWVEAVLVAGVPYQRSTLHALDARRSGNTGNCSGIYAELADPYATDHALDIALDPLPGVGNTITVRYVADFADDLTVPPFPPDFDQTLVDGAIAIGLARMDERFDSAGYFDARFVDAVSRLRRRRHGRVGRGAVAIRVAL